MKKYGCFNRPPLRTQAVVQAGASTLNIKTVPMVKYTQCIRLAGPMHHFPNHCHERTSGMSNSNSTVKFCKKCQTETERYAHGNCKPCAIARTALWAVNNKDRKKKSASDYLSGNKEKERIRKAAWCAANVEKVKETRFAWYTLNKDSLISRVAEWKAANPEKAKAHTAAWKAANPEARRVHSLNRRASKRANGGKLTKDISIKLFKLQKGLCVCCGVALGEKYHLDHIVPLALGGANEDSNMQLLRPICNLQKHTKHPVDFMQSRGFLL